jgi:hypothetical protein
MLRESLLRARWNGSIEDIVFINTKAPKGALCHLKNSASRTLGPAWDTTPGGNPPVE